ncbi:stage V sporulation protein D (sporulation-specific penicillin-binding protein) [Thermodesulfitimonas autotrophica]|uniref:Stage V sporulation protein D (Sporulation-specific penicillin-binding protein) n=1 Tax=Thermodesulfitimonas autotrophica TaxID=1894989 RepID=A0A3N5ANL4_9THEO|nr:stage V sporulation protein D [Thermodesulfitimonas autotrophica]RPF46786.1 stage V sporulation protein D (sporulation-specific penicillin-binding protein) [Thermodesulfitimonas autotrophica]
MSNLVLRKRLASLFVLAAFLFFLLVCRLFWLQLVRGAELERGAWENRVREITVEAKRGDICDRNGKVLVTSVSCDSVAAMPAQVADAAGTAAKLAPLLKMDQETLYRLLTRKQAFVWLKRKVDFETARQIRGLKLPGIELIEESRRQYNCGSLAAHILGFVGVDNQGLTGVEKTAEKFLRGVPGKIVVEQDAAGRNIPAALHHLYPPVPGNRVLLTIDETIQYFVERELDKIVDTYHPAAASIIVMDPKTGEILALGNRPTFDPAAWRDVPQAVWDRNPAIWQLYEPGSTFKIVTAAAALSEGVVGPESHFYCPGFVQVADRRIRCWKEGGHGSESFAEVVQNSCNPGFIQVGLSLGKEKFYKYIRAFGFGRPTGINLPGEAKGILIPENKATNLNIATMSIGQSIAVTPIQLVTAAAAVANGGELLAPRVIRAVVSPDGKTVRVFKPEHRRRVLSREKAQELARLLENVVLKGTGVNAYLDGYRTAGKTGTAQVVGPGGGYVPGKYVSSFVGFAPVDNPRLVTLVVVWEPQGGVYFGSLVAAPAFKAVMQDALRYLGVPQQAGLEKPEKPWYLIEEEPKPVTVPEVVDLPVHEAIERLRAAGLRFTVRGQGDVVRAQVPQGGATVLTGTKVILELKAAPEGGPEVAVPDLTGLTIKDAAVLLEKMGLVLVPEGSGVAVQQTPVPGTRLRRGGSVRVIFASPEAEESQPTVLHP